MLDVRLQILKLSRLVKQLILEQSLRLSWLAHVQEVIEDYLLVLILLVFCRFLSFLFLGIK